MPTKLVFLCVSIQVNSFNEMRKKESDKPLENFRLKMQSIKNIHCLASLFIFKCHTTKRMTFN